MDRAVAARVDDLLPRTHPNGQIASYYNWLREYPSRPGKGIRSRLALLSTAAHGARWSAGLTAAAALETFQNWVLIHDDIEDDSDERRGAPTLHRQVGVPLAINIGDALHVYMWQLLLTDDRLPTTVPREFLWMVHRTAEGQHLDLAWVQEARWDVSEAEYLEMVRLKTACYTVVSPLRLGALCAGGEPDERLGRAGEELGVAFQIRDDVLNLTPGAPSGKEFAGDLFEGKRTLILAHFFSVAGDRARAQVRRLLSAPRSRKRGSDIDLILDHLQRSGSLEYAQEQAQVRVKRGMDLLEAALANVPGVEAAERLLAEVESLASRNS